MRLAVFTTCPNHRVPEATTLFDSLRRFLPDADRVLVVADRLHGAVPYPDGCMVIAADALDIPDLSGFAFRYDIEEFTAALKPFVFRRLLERHGYTHCLYFDPDIEVFSPLPTVRQALAEDASFILTPHILAPAESTDGPNDLTVMRQGIYNLGFLGVSGTAEAMELLAWWSRWARWSCVDDQRAGLFVDQKFMDLMPGFAPGARILHDPGLNVAYWNLAQRRFVPDGPSGPEVDGSPLGFFHYSGFDPACVDHLSSQTQWFRDDDVPGAWRAFLASYADRLRAAGHGTVPAGCYAYGRFASGVPIPRIVRRMFRDDHPAWAGDPFETYEAWAHLPAMEGVVAVGSAVPSLMMQWLQARTPALEGFPVTELAGSDRVTRWWLQHGTEVGADRRLLEPVALAAGLRPISLRASCPSPSPERADATVFAPFNEDSPAGHAGHAEIASLSQAVGAVEQLDLLAGTAGPRQASGRLLAFTLAPGQLAQAVNAPQLLRSAYRILVPAAEEVRISASFLAALEHVDEVWAPTRCIQARLVTAVEVPVLHMPISWRFPVATSSCHAAPVPHGRPYILAEADGFAGPDDLLVTMDAYRRAFGSRAAGGRPALLIQLHDPAGPDDILRTAVAEHPDVTVLGPSLDAARHSALVAGAACILAMHRGQALGFPVTRAMACGVPVIATEYGGCTDLLTPATGFPVGFRMVPSRVDGGQGWAEADACHAAWSLREVFDRPDDAKCRADAARDALESAHAPRQVAARQAARLAQLGLTPPVPSLA